MWVVIATLVFMANGGSFVTNVGVYAPEKVTACIATIPKRNEMYFECMSEDQTRIVRWAMTGVSKA